MGKQHIVLSALLYTGSAAAQVDFPASVQIRPIEEKSWLAQQGLPLIQRDAYFRYGATPRVEEIITSMGIQREIVYELPQEFVEPNYYVDTSTFPTFRNGQPLELVVHAQNADKLALLHVEISGSEGIIMNYAVPHDGIMDDPAYGELVTAYLSGEEKKEEKKGFFSRLFAKHEQPESYAYTYTLRLPEMNDGWHNIWLQFAQAEDVVRPIGREYTPALDNGLTVGLPLDGTYMVSQEYGALPFMIYISADGKLPGVMEDGELPNPFYAKDSIAMPQ